MTTLLVATRNAHKVQEIAEILGNRFHCLALAKFPGAPTPVEDADTFAGNARRKVLSLAQWAAENPDTVRRGVAPATEVYILADDSGLEVDALDGAPGVHSARFAAEDAAAGNAPDAANNAKLLQLLKGKPAAERKARFRCVLALYRLDLSATQPSIAVNESVVFDGACEGRIAERPSGVGGFGYDPLFIPEGRRESFAELGGEIKNELSHRARALVKLREFFSQ